MARVFISHAGEDRALAAELFGWMSGAGHELFYDRDLRAGLTVGEQWEQRLFERLRWADAVVCLITAAYVRSPWCSAEVGIAIARGSRLLPVVAERSAAHPLLQGTQHADYAADPAGARSAVGAALTRLDNAGGRGWLDGRSPFPGLRAFDSDMHSVYFGRRSEAAKLVELLRSPSERADQGLLVVTGPSGCGKSSLVRAGLLPEMADEPGWWALPAVRPGADPLAALGRELTGEARRLRLGWELPDVQTRLQGQNPTGVFDELLLAVPGNGHHRLLVVIDQLEELVTRTSTADQVSFARLLRAALDGPVQVVATLRPEYLASLLASPQLAGLPIRTFALRPLPPEALPDVIRGPAEIAGIAVDPELVTRLVTDTGTGEALPLLAFTLQQLAADVTRGGRLSISHYELLGGVQGALTSQADTALVAAAAATGRTQEHVIASLLRLVTVDEQGHPTRTRVPVADLPDTVRTELAAFTGRRLLSTDTENDTVVIGVAHEAFLSAWPPLKAAITGAAAALRARRGVEQAATEWDSNGRHRDRLWERGRLAAALNDLEDPNPDEPSTSSAGSGNRSARAARRRWIPRWERPRAARVAISDRAMDFLHVSVRTDRRRRIRAVSVLSVLLLIAGALAAVAAHRGNRLAEQLATANAEYLGGQALARALDQPVTATQLALAAWRADPKNPTARTALAQRYMAMRSVDTVFPEVTPSPISRVERAKNADVAVLQHTGGATIVQNMAAGLPEHWELPDAPVGSNIRLSPDGSSAAGIDAAGNVLLWDLTNRSDPTTLLPGTSLGWQPDFVGGFSIDGARLGVVTPSSSPDGPVLSLWDVKRRTLIEPLTALGSGLTVTGMWFTDNPDLILISDKHDGADGLPHNRLTVRSASAGTVVRDLGDAAVAVQNGSSVITCIDGTSDSRDVFVITATDTGTERSRIPLPYDSTGHCDPTELALTADGDHVETGIGLDTEPYWQVHVTSLTTAATFDIALPSGRQLSSGTSGSTLDDFRRAEDLAAVDAPDGTLTALVARGTSLLRLAGGRRDWTADSRFPGYSKFEASDDRRYLVTASVDGIAVYDTANGDMLSQLDYASEPTTDFPNAFETDDQLERLFRHEGAFMLTQWTLPSLTRAAEYQFPSSPDTGPPSAAATVGDDQRLYALIGNGHQLSEWDTQTQQMIGESLRIGPPLTDVAQPTTPDLRTRPGHPDQLLATSTDGKLVLWGIQERRELAELPVQLNFHRSGPFEVDPTGQRVAVLTPSDTLELWDIDTGQRVAPAMPAPNADQIIGFTADGNIVTDDNRDHPKMIQFWDLEQGRVSGEIDLPSSSAGVGGPIVDGQRLGIDTSNMLPFELAMTGQGWFTALCATNDRDFTDAERTLLPPGTSDEPPCRP